MKKNNTILYYGCAAQARYASSNHGLLYSPSQAHLFNFSLARTYLNFSNGFRAFSSERKRQNSWKLSVRSIYMDSVNFTKHDFINALLKNFKQGNVYTVLVKVEYLDSSGNRAWCMLNVQKGIIYRNKSDFIELVKEFFDEVYIGYIEYMSRYHAQEVLSIQIMYILNNDSYRQYSLKNINKEKLDKNLVNVKQTKLDFSESLLPLTTNEKFYGKRLTPILDYKKQFVTSLYINGINFIKLVNKKSKDLNQEFINFDSKTRFYRYKLNEIEYIITVSNISKTETVKTIYLMTGFKFKDNILDKELTTKIFSRQIGNTTIEFDGADIINKEIKLKLPIIRLNYKPFTDLNSRIGTFDLETFRDYNSNSAVYALGFSTLSMSKTDKKTSMYYLTKDGNTSHEIIIKCINEMLSSDYRDHIYFTHNLGGYDIIFILHALKLENKIILENKLKGINTIVEDDKKIKVKKKKPISDVNKKSQNKDHYEISTILRDDRILKCVIKVKTPSGYNKITFIDSYNILPDKLDNLAKSFGTEIQKGLFPYEFVKSNTLNYVGITPSIEYYKINNEVISQELYNELIVPQWDLRKQTLHYLERDLLSLLEIINTYNHYVYKRYNVQLTESLTIARLALNIYLKRYLGDNLIPVVLNNSLFTSIKAAYYGGVAEVYRPYGKNLRYYDVNSLYPFVAKNTMPGHECKYIESKKGLKLSELFGFFYCKVTTNNQYLGLLPVHNQGLIMPNGQWYGWYFSEELKFAEVNGYNIEVIKGYQFNKIDNLFSSYVDDLYKIKANSEGSEKLITKFLLNSLLGRFGMSIFKLKTDIVSVEKAKKLAVTNYINSVKAISDTDVLISYNKEISRKLVEEHGLNYIEILNSNSKLDLEKNNSFKDVAVSISAAVTAYARIFMAQTKLDILKNGGNLYYTDTDSIVTDIDLPDNLVGSELGQFKLEFKLKEGFFISAKTYCLILEKEYIKKNKNKDTVIKAKGVFKTSLDVEKFKSLYFNKQDVEAIKSNNKTNYLEGYVNIESGIVKLKHDAYTKRSKIYDNNGLWIDTKPLNYQVSNMLEDTNSKPLNSPNNNDLCALIKYNKPCFDLIKYNKSITDLILYLPTNKAKFINYAQLESMINEAIHESDMRVANHIKMLIYSLTGILYHGKDGTMYIYSPNSKKIYIKYKKNNKWVTFWNIKYHNGYVYIKNKNKFYLYKG
uniref:Probable DNA polymerase n=2 Tax=Podospora anserina TaxID=2587412 RepID=DPOM_PODAS|nr:RecName: Full=Probable DNA polymerase [Podospora anserina]CAA43117.2 DNA polymerase [Podospora anserina]